MSESKLFSELNMSFLWSMLLLLCLVGCNDSSEIQEETIPRVKVYTVGKQATGQARRLSGKVQAADKSTLSFGISGKVVEIIVKTGQTVVKGQLLAKLDEKPFQLTLQEVRANLNSARAELEKAKGAYNRTATLFKEEAASQKDFDSATALLATANGKLEAAKSALDQAELDFQRTKLTAPYSGKVVDVPIDAFQEIAASGEAVILQSDEALEIDVRVPETLIREVDYGKVVQASFPTIKDLVVPGVVTSVGAETEAGNAFPVTITLSDSTSDLRPGMTASVTFNFRSYLEGRSAFLIPLSAIAIEAGLTSAGSSKSQKDETKNEAPVYVFNSEKKVVELRKLLVGDLRGNEIEVFEGLKSGDQVVSAGIAFIREWPSIS